MSQLIRNCVAAGLFVLGIQLLAEYTVQNDPSVWLGMGGGAIIGIAVAILQPADLR